MGQPQEPRKLDFVSKTMAASGEVIAGVPGQVLRVYRMSSSPSADLSGKSSFTDGSGGTQMYGSYDWALKSEYGFDQNGTAYLELTAGNGLFIILASSTNTEVNVYYEFVTP